MIRAVFQYFFDNLMLRIHFIIRNLTYMVSFSILKTVLKGMLTEVLDLCNRSVGSKPQNVANFAP